MLRIASTQKPKEALIRVGETTYAVVLDTIITCVSRSELLIDVEEGANFQRNIIIFKNHPNTFMHFKEKETSKGTKEVTICSSNKENKIQNALFGLTATSPRARAGPMYSYHQKNPKRNL